MEREYRYWAWLDEGVSSADAAREVIRTWESPEGVERLTRSRPGTGSRDIP